jgi:hypothetical protein
MSTGDCLFNISNRTTRIGVPSSPVTGCWSNRLKILLLFISLITVENLSIRIATRNEFIINELYRLVWVV